MQRVGTPSQSNDPLPASVPRVRELVGRWGPIPAPAVRSWPTTAVPVRDGLGDWRPPFRHDRRIGLLELTSHSSHGWQVRWEVHRWEGAGLSPSPAKVAHTNSHTAPSRYGRLLMLASGSDASALTQGPKSDTTRDMAVTVGRHRPHRRLDAFPRRRTGRIPRDALVWLPPRQALQVDEGGSVSAA